MVPQNKFKRLADNEAKLGRSMHCARRKRYIFSFVNMFYPQKKIIVFTYCNGSISLPGLPFTFREQKF